MREQRRGRKLAMTPGEIDAFLSGQRVCRVATIGAQDRPHVAPLWFVWVTGGHQPQTGDFTVQGGQARVLQDVPLEGPPGTRLQASVTQVVG